MRTIEDLEEEIKYKFENNMYIDWYNVSLQKDLTIDFLEKYENYIRWDVYSSTCSLYGVHVDILRKFKGRLSWHEISKSSKLSIEIIEEFKDYLLFSIISKYGHYYDSLFLEKFKNRLNFNYIYELRQVDEDFIRKNILDQIVNDRIILLIVLTYQKLSEDFIGYIIENVILGHEEWIALCKNQTLSEQFIEKHIHELKIDIICGYQVLSEDFIRKYKYIVNWNLISYNQALSEDFIWEFSEQVNFDELRYNNKIDKDLRSYLDKNNFKSGGTNLSNLLKENNLT